MADFQRGSFRVRGDTVEIFPAHLEDRAWRISLFGDEVEEIVEFDPLTGDKTDQSKAVKIYANSHYVTPKPTLQQAVNQIKPGTGLAVGGTEAANRLLEAQRLEQRCNFDHRDDRSPPAAAPASRTIRATSPAASPASRRPPCLNICPTMPSIFADESHVTVPQIGGMYRGDFGANRPWRNLVSGCPPVWTTDHLKFEEWDAMRPQTVCVSATPGGWEMDAAPAVFSPNK